MARQARRPLVRGALLHREMLRLHPATANFAAYLELTGLRAILQEDQMHLSVRCRLLREIRGSLCCFFHILGEDGEEPLRGRVALEEGSLGGSRGGDDLLIRVEQAIRPALSRRFTELRLGFCDPHTGICLPVCASSLPVTAEYTAVRVRWNEPPPARLLYSFGWPVLQMCRVVLEGGVELVGYSLQRLEQSVWIRLKWSMHDPGARRLEFLGSVLPGDGPEGLPASFEQEMRLADGANPCLEQNLIARIPGLDGAPLRLRGGVLDSQKKYWLRVLDCSKPTLARTPYFFLRFPQDAGQG